MVSFRVYFKNYNPIFLGDQPNKCDTRIIHFRESFILIVKQDGFDEKGLNASYGKQRLRLLNTEPFYRLLEVNLCDSNQEAFDPFQATAVEFTTEVKLVKYS